MTGVEIAMWSLLEINVAIIMGSIPNLKAFITKAILGQKSGYALSSSNNGKTFSLPRSNERVHGRIDTSLSKEGAGLFSSTVVVTREFEMISYTMDDQSSEKELVHHNPFDSYGKAYACVDTTRTSALGHSDM